MTKWSLRFTSSFPVSLCAYRATVAYFISILAYVWILFKSIKFLILVSPEKKVWHCPFKNRDSWFWELRWLHNRTESCELRGWTLQQHSHTTCISNLVCIWSQTGQYVARSHISGVYAQFYWWFEVQHNCYRTLFFNIRSLSCWMLFCSQIFSWSFVEPSTDSALI